MRSFRPWWTWMKECWIRLGVNLVASRCMSRGSESCFWFWMIDRMLDSTQSHINENEVVWCNWFQSLYCKLPTVDAHRDPGFDLWSFPHPTQPPLPLPVYLYGPIWIKPWGTKKNINNNKRKWCLWSKFFVISKMIFKWYKQWPWGSLRPLRGPLRSRSNIVKL